MVVFDFCNWVNGTLLPMVRTHHPNIPSSVSNHTVCLWLHKLGFKPSSTRKGVYIDGHERDDVVKYRKLYLKCLEILSSTHAPPLFCTDEIPPEPFLGPQRRNLVLLFKPGARLVSYNCFYPGSQYACVCVWMCVCVCPPPRL